MGIPDRFITFGKREYLLRECGLDVEGIVDAVERILSSPSPSRIDRAERIAPSLKGFGRN
jgi:hypothetical protein